MRRIKAVQLVGASLCIAALATLALALWSVFAEYGRAAEPTAAAGRGSLADEPLDRQPGESAPDYFRRLSLATHDKMRPARSEPVPASENYVIFAVAELSPLVSDGLDSDFEFRDSDRALDRGFGACSQYATIVYDRLRREGFAPRRVAWPQHTVVAVEHEGQEYVLDPYFGTTLRKSVDQLREDPALVDAHYRRLNPDRRFTSDGWSSRQLVDYAESFFSVEPHMVQATGQIYGWSERVTAIAYPAKWAMPALLAVLGVAALAMSRRMRRERS